MIGLERMLHAQQKPETQNSQHDAPYLPDRIKYELGALVRPAFQHPPTMGKWGGRGWFFNGKSGIRSLKLSGVRA